MVTLLLWVDILLLNWVAILLFWARDWLVSSIGRYDDSGWPDVRVAV